MKSAVDEPHGDLFEHIRWRAPEYWMLVLSAAAWVTLAMRAGVHVHHPSAAANWQHWMLMVLAMMLPIKIDGVRLTAERSLWSRRHRSVAGYLVGYLGVWALAGLPLAWAFTAFEISHRINWAEGAAIGFLIAAAWLLSPWKEIAARMCHRSVPLSPTGWEADRDCIVYGWIAGMGCAFNCWPLMLVCWLSAHAFVAMVFGFIAAWLDRHFYRNYKMNALALAALGTAFGAFVVVY